MSAVTQEDARLSRVVVIRTGGGVTVYHPAAMTEAHRLALLDMLEPGECCRLRLCRLTACPGVA